MISLPWMSQLCGSASVHTVAPLTASSRIPASGKPFAISLPITGVRQSLSTNTGSTAKNVTQLSTRIPTGSSFPAHDTGSLWFHPSGSNGTHLLLRNRPPQLCFTEHRSVCFWDHPIRPAEKSSWDHLHWWIKKQHRHLELGLILETISNQVCLLCLFLGTIHLKILISSVFTRVCDTFPPGYRGEPIYHLYQKAIFLIN